MTDKLNQVSQELKGIRNFYEYVNVSADLRCHYSEEDRELIDKYESLIAKARPKLIYLYRLMYVEGKKQSEIAELLNISKVYVAKLHKSLKEYFVEAMEGKKDGKPKRANKT